MKKRGAKVYDFYAYHRYREIATIEQAAHAYYYKPAFRKSLPAHQASFYEYVIWQYLNLRLPRPTS